MLVVAYGNGLHLHSGRGDHCPAHARVTYVPPSRHQDASSSSSCTATTPASTPAPSNSEGQFNGEILYQYWESWSAGSSCVASRGGGTWLASGQSWTDIPGCFGSFPPSVDLELEDSSAAMLKDLRQFLESESARGELLSSRRPKHHRGHSAGQETIPKNIAEVPEPARVQGNAKMKAPEAVCVVAVQRYSTTGPGYLSVERGDHLCALLDAPEPGDADCHWSSYVYAKHQESDAEPGWLPLAVLWVSYSSPDGRTWLQSPKSDAWCWEDSLRPT